MFDRIQFFLTAYFLVSFACSGCATTDGYYKFQTIDPDSMRAIVEDPSGSNLPFKAGDKISITTKEKIRLSTINVYNVVMIVGDVDTSRVKGIVQNVPEDEGQGYEEVEDLLVEINFENIEKLLVWRWIKASKTPTAPGEVAGGVVMVVICILSLLMACK